MVTYYNSKDMTSFGKYLFSKERTELVKNNTNFPDELLTERLQEVTHADFLNWKESLNTSK